MNADATATTTTATLRSDGNRSGNGEQHKGEVGTPTKTSTSTITSSAVAVLALLEAYQDQHGAGVTAQQAAIWNLTKARRVLQARHSTDNHSLTAHAVRHELQATRRLTTTMDKQEADDEGELLDEEHEVSDDVQENVPATTSTTAPTFALQQRLDDPHTSHTKEATTTTLEHSLSSAAAADPDTATTMGLRHRKKGIATTAVLADTSTVTKEWSVDTENDASSCLEPPHKKDDTEDGPLLWLFSTLPPAELRAAQAQAVQSLTAYCHAATLAAALLHATNSSSSSSDTTETNEQGQK
jgi:hypothetical protein